MSSDKGYWQPPGLSAIQFQLNIALTRRANGDEFGAMDSLRDLAILTESKEIIDLAEDFQRETNRALARIRANKPYTDAHRYAFQMDEVKYLKDRNYEFLKLLITESSKRGITIKAPGDALDNLKERKE